MKCKVCGKWFKLQADKRYEEIKKEVFSKPVFFECFDCPKCGCQNIVNVRLRTVYEINDRVEDKE